MFGNEEELIKSISRNIIIDIIGANHLHDTIISNCFDSIEGEHSGRVKVLSLLNTDALVYKDKNNSAKEPSLGLLNMNWMKKTLTIRPATIILIYDIRNKPEGITWKDYENSIYMDINKAKKMDNYPFVNIIVLIYSNVSSFSFDNVNEDKERGYAIRKLLDPKNLYYVNSTEGLKSISRKLSSYVIKISLSYYRTIKKNLKLKKNNTSDNKEKLIKYNIKLGIISLIKNKKITWKYLEEAYHILANVDPRNYNYSSYVRNSYFEIKSVADWLIYKIIGLRLLDNSNFNSIVTSFANHIQNFSKISVYEDKDPMSLIEYYWRILRYQYLIRLLEDYGKPEIISKIIILFPGYYYMVIFNV